jgi:hypothetical protein
MLFGVHVTCASVGSIGDVRSRVPAEYCGKYRGCHVENDIEGFLLYSPGNSPGTTLRDPLDTAPHSLCVHC